MMLSKVAHIKRSSFSSSSSTTTTRTALSLLVRNRNRNFNSIHLHQNALAALSTRAPLTTGSGLQQQRSISSMPPGGGQPLGNIFQQAQGQQQSYLEQYGVDLTAMARKEGKIDPIIGRHEEIGRTMEILARRSKNNPLLIGEPGVGKTAIAEGLAQRIVHGEVPASIQDKRVIMVDVSSMVAGSMMRGQFEERLKGLLKEVSEADGEIILFIDEIHTVVGAGAVGGSGSMDMSNMIKPALARGELQLVGATTLDEYKKHIEKDAALARRFQTVYVPEPNLQDTVSILRGLKTSYELHHGIRIRDEALVSAATLSDRYISDRFQPDKAIDLVDEACSKLKLEQESKPETIWKVERDLLTKQMEFSALERDKDMSQSKKSVERRRQVKEDIAQLEAELKVLNDAWQAERDELEKGKRAQEELEKAKMELESARRKGDFNKAGELLHSTIPRLERGLEAIVAEQEKDHEYDNESSGRQQHRSRMLEEAVTPDTIAQVISRHTGIPVSRLTGDESKKLLLMEDELRKRVVGQEHALEAVSNVVRLSRTNLQSHHRTLGNLLFVGPTGVGKTELCKALAEFLFEDEEAMTRIDMSEYSEKHTVSRLIGAPPGYVGFEDGGVLTEAVRRRPYQVILLDEFEKGHRDVWNLLLQLFDDGRLTDSHGRTVDFRNTIVVMTSNIGAQVIADLPAHLKGTEPEAQESIMEVIRGTLSPELLNRIDETVVFNRLQRENMDSITAMGIEEIAKRLEEGQNMTLDVSQNSASCLAEKGYDLVYGARPLKRVLAKDLLNPLSKMVLEGGVKEGDTVRVRTRGEAERLSNNESFDGYLSGTRNSTDKNDVVVLRNHRAKEEEGTEDDPLLLEAK